MMPVKQALLWKAWLTGNEDRIVITSTSPDENAYFISNGTISFSRYFWTQVYNGNNLADAFTVGREINGDIG